MEIRQLNTFLQIAKVKNFTRTGEILGYCQSNISAQIQQLERELGVQLFNRIGHNVSLTQYGEELLPYAQNIVETAVVIENFMKSEESLGGTIKIGIVQSMFDILIQPVVNNYHKRFPKVNIEIIVDSTANLKEKIVKGTIDLACFIDDLLFLVDWHIWFEEAVPVVIVTNSSNKISKKTKVFLSDLHSEEFIIMEESASYVAAFQRFMAKNNIRITPFLKFQYASMARKMVEEGNYISVLPLYCVKKSVEDEKISVLNVENYEQTQYVQLLLHKNKIISPQEKGFLEELKSAMQTYIL